MELKQNDLRQITHLIFSVGLDVEKSLNTTQRWRIGLRRGPSGSKECGRRNGIRLVV